MTLHTIGDSHSAIPFQQIPGVVFHHLGPVLCFTVGKHKHDLVNGINISTFAQPGDAVIFVFGEIDCRCQIHKFISSNRSYVDVIDGIIKDYFVALQENEKLVPVKMVVYNVIPPSSEVGTPIDPAYPFVGTDYDRLTYVRYFNDQLRAKCADAGYLFMDVYDKYADDEGFLNPELSDGHVHVKDPRYLQEWLVAHGLL